MKMAIAANEKKRSEEQFMALKMALLSKRIEQSENCAQLELFNEERTVLLKQYYSQTFGSNVVPFVSQLS